MSGVEWDGMGWRSDRGGEGRFRGCGGVMGWDRCSGKQGDLLCGDAAEFS